MTTPLQKMIAATVLPSAMAAEMTAHTLSLAAGNLRSYLAPGTATDDDTLMLPPAAATQAADHVGPLAVPPAGSLPA